jgi:hypothetical protein
MKSRREEAAMAKEHSTEEKAESQKKKLAELEEEAQRLKDARAAEHTEAQEKRAVDREEGLRVKVARTAEVA